MSRFSSNKILDYKDLKANGFTFGGTGLTCMCLYIAWWFSGDYPTFLHSFDIPIFFFWALVCGGTTANWEIMLQQNFEANERKAGKFAKVSKKEMRQKAILYRLASWPNLTQLTFMYSIPFGGLAWLQACQAQWPMQNTPMYHYGIASAMGYALSMFSETLRDRKLVTLEQDLLVLIVGFCFPMVSVLIDGLTYGSAVTISPPEPPCKLQGSPKFRSQHQAVAPELAPARRLPPLPPLLWRVVPLRTMLQTPQVGRSAPIISPWRGVLTVL